MSKQTGTCVVCKKFAKLRCSACQSAFYCGKEHQSNDWRNHKKVCRAYKVKSSSELHQYVVAAKDIKKGEVIIDEIPLVIGPDHLTDREELACIGCHGLKGGKSRCPRCNWPVCSLNCPGLTEITRHGAECALLTKVKSGLIRKNSSVILPLRCLLLQRNDPKKWEVFLKMAVPAVTLATSTGSNESKLFLVEFILKPLMKSAPESLPDCSEDTVKKVYSVLDMYGLDVKAPQFEPLVAVCGVTSVVEHRCLPNARRLVDIHPVVRLPGATQLQCRVVMRATQDISKGENISMVFIGTWMFTWARQSSLASRRRVHCKCARCLDPRELGTDLGTLKCTKGGCSGWVLPINTLHIDTTDWRCETCGTIYPCRDVMELLVKIKNETEGGRVGENQGVAENESLLKRIQTWLHPNHYFCLIMKERLSNLYGLSLLHPIMGAQMTVAQLGRTAELCEDCLRISTNPAIVNEHMVRVGGILLLLSLANTEIAKRKKASGEWTPAHADKVLVECQEMVQRALKMKYAGIDESAAERPPIELFQRMVLSRLSK